MGGRLRITFLCALSAVLVPGISRAECAAPYTPAELGSDIGTLTTSLRALDEASFRIAGKNLESNLLCIRIQVPWAVYATTYRFIGAHHYLEGRADESSRWFRTALALDPTYEWDVTELPVGHPLREHFENEREEGAASAVALPDMDLNVPAGATLYLDGRPLKKAAATLDRPHLLQVVGDSDKTVRQVFMIEGNAIPEAFLVSTISVDEMASGKKRRKKNESAVVDASQEEESDPDAAYEVMTVQRSRPAAKTPLLFTSGAVVLAGGALYGASFAARTEFDRAVTTGELDETRTLTNTLVTAAGAVAGVGLGVGYLAVMLDAGPGIGIVGRF